MKLLLALALALAPHFAASAELQFVVVRGDEGYPPNHYESLNTVGSQWTEDGKLIVYTWVTESATDRVVDSSAIIHTADSRKIHISYGAYTRDLAPNEAPCGCDDFAMLRFEISGLDRADYYFILERRTTVAHSSIPAN